MNLLNFLIEEIIEQAIDELKAGTEHIKGFALYIKEHGSGLKSFLLYSPYYWNDDSVDSTFNRRDQIIAMALIGWNAKCEAFEIKAIAASPRGSLKYGPLMYEIVMSAIHPNFIMSDRSSVSKSAEGIWEKMFQRPDMNKIKLTNEFCLSRTKNQALDYKYQIKNPISYQSFLGNHQAAIKNASEYEGTSISSLEDRLDLDTEDFFDKLYYK